jgi:hypothetical protein
MLTVVRIRILDQLIHAFGLSRRGRGATGLRSGWPAGGGAYVVSKQGLDKIYFL